MSTLQLRINRAIDNSPLIPAEIARQAGITRSTVSGWQNGNIKSINAEHCLKVADVLGVSYAWLAAGLGPMKASSARKTATMPYLSANQAISHQESIDKLFGRPGVESVSLAMAGIAIDASCFAFRQADESMQPGIIQGDTLIMAPSKEILPGDLVLAVIGESNPILRRYRPRQMKGQSVLSYELTPLHPDYASITIDKDVNCRLLAAAIAHIQPL